MAIMQCTVLVVDDDPHIRDLLSFALQKAGLATREAADGEAALAEIALRAPDLVILDINMPRMDGIETCRRIRAQGDLPILFLSSRDDEIDRILGMELGADDYVVKPFSPREVVARVAAILRRIARTPAPRTVGQFVYGRLSLDADGWRALAGCRGATDGDRVQHRPRPGRRPAPGLHPRRHHRPCPWPRIRHDRPDHRQPCP